MQIEKEHGKAICLAARLGMHLTLSGCVVNYTASFVLFVQVHTHNWLCIILSFICPSNESESVTTTCTCSIFTFLGHSVYLQKSVILSMLRQQWMEYRRWATKPSICTSSCVTLTRSWVCWDPPDTLPQTATIRLCSKSRAWRASWKISTLHQAAWP